MMKSLGKIVAIIAINIWAAFVIATLWRWLVVPIWPEAPLLTMAHAYGLSLFIALIRFDHSKEYETPQLRTYVFLVIMPAITLGIAFVVKLFY